jgi:uncharacterized YccA/Bax inhibitor family protein
MIVLAVLVIAASPSLDNTAFWLLLGMAGVVIAMEVDECTGMIKLTNPTLIDAVSAIFGVCITVAVSCISLIVHHLLCRDAVRMLGRRDYEQCNITPSGIVIYMAAGSVFGHWAHGWMKKLLEEN